MKQTPGLRKRNGIWHMKKTVCGIEITGTTRTQNLSLAQLKLAHEVEKVRRKLDFGERPPRTFKEAAEHWRSLDSSKKNLKTYDNYCLYLDKVLPFIGGLDITEVDNDALQGFIESRKKEGVKNRTINASLQIVRRILNLAAKEWKDKNSKLFWLQSAPKISLLKLDDSIKAYPLSWSEQRALFAKLPEHLNDMATFMVNTGLRDQELCFLSWHWEQKLNGRSIFVIPGGAHYDDKLDDDEMVDYWRGTKNGEDKIVVLNEAAQAVIDKLRGGYDSDFVFTYLGYPVVRMNNSGWRNAWKKSDLPQEGVVKGVHNLRHTFARRLRVMGVSRETRAILLGHTSGNITTDYSAPEIQELIDAVDKLGQSEAKESSIIRTHSIKRVKRARRNAESDKSGTVH